MNDVITLVKQTKTVDEYGDSVITETTRDVFCNVKSIGMKEFYQANELGFKPEICFVLADHWDYEDEPIVVHEATRYSVLRTYRKSNELEITCTKEVNRYVGA